jgi:hypothetical protein
VNLKSLFDKGKKIVDERGGVESLKGDAGELQGIAKGKGSLTDKAKAAAAAIKDPGAGRGEKAGHPGKPHPQGKEPQPGKGKKPRS